MDALEDSQKAAVDSVLEQPQHYIGVPTFTKERALDYLISLKIVAKESNHPKSAFFNAVLRVMRRGFGFLISSLNNSCVLCLVIKRMRRCWIP